MSTSASWEASRRGFGCLLLVPFVGGWSSRDRLAVVLATLSLPFSGMSILMVGTVGLSLLLLRGWRIALRFMVVPLVVQAAWAILYGGSELGGLTGAPGFMVDGLVGAGEHLLGGSHWLGIAFAIAYVAMLLALARTVPGPRSLPFALLLSASLCLALIGVGRARPEQP